MDPRSAPFRRRDPQGQISGKSAEEWWKVDRALVTPPQFVTEEDLGILRLIWADRGNETGLRAFGLGPKHGAEILQRMAASHRLYPEDDLGCR
jgi:hypothetical protein